MAKAIARDTGSIALWNDHLDEGLILLGSTNTYVSCAKRDVMYTSITIGDAVSFVTIRDNQAGQSKATYVQKIENQNKPPSTRVQTFSYPDPQNHCAKGRLLFQTSCYDATQLERIHAEYKSDYASAPRFLFGDNNQDKDVVGKYDRTIGYGIVTTFVGAPIPNLRAYKSKMDEQFKPLADHLRNGYDVIVPTPTAVDISKDRRRYYDRRTNKQAIFHNLGTGIASLSMDRVKYIQTKIDELAKIAQNVEYVEYYKYDPNNEKHEQKTDSDPKANQLQRQSTIESESTLEEIRDSFYADDNPLRTSSTMRGVSHLTLGISPLSIKRHGSTAITDGYFAADIMRRIQHGNNLNLSKIKMKKAKIGRGTSAIVHLAMYNKREIALKEYKFNETDFEFNTENLSEFQNELNILQLLGHNNVNVIHFYGYHLNVRKKVLKFAFEYCPNGTVFDLIHPLLVSSPYQYKDMIKMLLDIANGMSYMHSKHIINRDLKARNLLLFDDYHVKITDFGAGVIVEGDKDDCFEQYKLYEPIGTSGYMAPEVVNVCVKHKQGNTCSVEQGYNYKIDVFSFGCICYEFWTKKFVSGIQYLTRYEHLKEDLHLDLVPSECPDEFQDVITLCWQFNPEKRPPFDGVIEMLRE
eukprot:524817_1